jgi:hypothetical protein
VIAANSINLATSAFERASREISIPKIAPTSPEHTRLTSSVNLVGQAVLAHRRLGVLAHLRHRRLPQVDHR